MACLLGIDLGTSSIKAMILDTDIGEAVVGAASHDVEIPRSGYAEQSPELWWTSLIDVLSGLRQKHPMAFESISAIGFSGQMHGLVVTDKDGHPLRPAILWLDQRSEKQLSMINEVVTKEELGHIFHNRASTGFGLPSLLWIKENEPGIFDRIAKVMLPKDYLRYKITGKFGADTSDASSTLLMDIEKRQWASTIYKRFDISETVFPECHESTELAGSVSRQCARETGLKEGIPVVYGSGDQQAQSIGNGAVREGLIISNIGTGGQISTYSKTDRYDPQLRTHTFCHAIDKAYTIYGASLSSGLSLKWLKNNVLRMNDYGEVSSKAQEVAAGSEGVIYLPYLSGERTPHMNPNAKGMFFGLQLGHDDRHLIRAVMEGVIFSLKDSLEIFKEMGITADRIIASGGGASSPLWLQIQADIFEKDVQVCEVKEQACLGACLLAGIGTGFFTDVADACNRYVRYEEKIYHPLAENVKRYRASYETFKKLYQQTAALM